MSIAALIWSQQYIELVTTSTSRIVDGKTHILRKEYLKMHLHGSMSSN
jgi:hypothetical protein